ncbi:MAG: xanthine dehydrogenase family protein molybdopterin-binding subunit [Chloroflexi bacterium]|nr:xanthine dehydrogenase family protein molybdopterin-binding subunit [Chloroflexota bacterium]
MVTAKSVALPRVDAREKVTGRALYTEDLPSPYGVAYCAILHSPYSHARIRSIHAEKAERLPGVLAVLTREHLGATNPYIPSGDLPLNQPFIAMDKVRHDGEPVAAVAAESLAVAQHALSLIEVDYEELPAVFDVRDAVAPNSPRLHDAFTSNVFWEYRWNWGDAEKGFREADRVFEDTYYFPSVFQYPMENVGACFAEFRGDGVELVAPIQHPFPHQDEIGEMFGLPPERVRIRMPYVGGGFGAKELKTNHLIALWLAHKTGRPIMTVPSAWESIRTDGRHPMVYKVKTGVKADGTLWAQDIELLVDSGSYARALSQIVARLAVAGAWGPYRVPHMRMVGYAVLTNRVPPGAFRALAKAQVTWGYECNLDSIARAMGVDPMEFRIKNFMRRGDPIAEGASPLDTDYDVLLRKAAQAIGWDGRSNRVGPEAAKRPTGKGPFRGRGLSTTFRHGFSEGSNNFVTAILDRHGKVRLLHSAAEIGMGVYAVMTRLAAQAMGIPENDIEVGHADTEHPHSDGIGSSRDTVCMGNAVQDACEDLKRELLSAAAMCKGGRPEEWRLAQGRLWHGEHDFSPSEIVLGTHPRSGVIMGKGSYITPRRNNPFLGIVPHWEASAGAAEVEVDPETGEVRLLKLSTVADVGKAILPGPCKGQLDGGAVMGLGDTLYEEVVYQEGRLINGDPFQYRLPVMADVPEEFHSVMVENGDGPGPLGSKGMGQSGVSTVAPAIGNAVYDAIGVRIKDLPITPEKVLRALGKL